MIGKTVGKYRFVDQLGRGGMGAVYKAIDETLDREVAIKVLIPELADSDVLKRFRAEATALARLNHPDIATIYELYRSDRDLLMVMEFVRGETLDKLTERSGPLPPERAALLIDRVLGALEHAHRAGIVHRDMKPANVMVTEHGGVKVMDFGIARIAGAEHMTVDGYMMGTPAYMAPEQVRGDEVDGRADLYSVGVVLYRLLTNALPFRADTAIAMVQKQISELPTPLSVHRPGLPEWCESIIQRALAKAPGDRFQTAEEFRDSVARAAGFPPPDHARVFVAADLERITPLPAVAKAPSPLTPSGAPAIPVDSATVVLRREQGVWVTPGFVTSVLAILVLGAAAVRTMSPPTMPAVKPVAPAAIISAPLPLKPEPAARVQPGAGVVTGPTRRATRPARSATDATVTSDRAGGPPADVARSAEAASFDEPLVDVIPVAPAVTTAIPRATVTQVPLVFDARMLVAEGDGWSEREATLLLADRVTFTANNNLLESIPYSGVQSVSFARGRQPLVATPAGPEPVVKVGGAFSFLRGERNWITLHTANGFVVMRVDDDRLNPVLRAIQERTGRRIDHVTVRKDDK